MPPPRTKAPPPEEWEKHKEEMQGLYINGKTLADLMKYMESKHGFVAS